MLGAHDLAFGWQVLGFLCSSPDLLLCREPTNQTQRQPAYRQKFAIVRCLDERFPRALHKVCSLRMSSGQMSHGIHLRCSSRRQSSKRLVYRYSNAASVTAARTDSLTGIANRAAFLENAKRVLARCRRDRAPVSVVTFDLDRFKAVNDRYSHAVGDTVIRKFCTLRFGRMTYLGAWAARNFAVVLPGSGIEATLGGQRARCGCVPRSLRCKAP